MLIDSHCHLQFRGYDEDRDLVLGRCQQRNVIMNVVGTQQDTSKKAVELAEANDNIYATIGLHPIHLHATQVDEEEESFLSREEDFDEAFYDELAKSEKVIAVGECGLELYHLPDYGNPSANAQGKIKILEKQKEIFIAQYNFALKHDLPIVIHVRDAYEEMVGLLETLRNPSVPTASGHLPFVRAGQTLSPPYEGGVAAGRGGLSGVVHCYSSNWQNAKQFLDMGLYLGFTGVITFPPKKLDPQPTLDLLEVVEKCPLDKILVETDAPYLAPQAYRGQKCEPWMVEEVVKKIAQIKHLSVEEVEKITTENFLMLFRKVKLS